MADKTKIEITVTMVPKMIMAVRYIFMKNFLKMQPIMQETSIEMLLLKKYDFPEWWWWWWSCDMHKKYIDAIVAVVITYLFL